MAIYHRYDEALVRFMGFRFSKRIKIAPGVKVNIGLGGVSASVGGRGASVNIGKRGVYASAGIPGSGLSYRTKLGGSAARRSQQRQEKQLERQKAQQARIEALSKVQINLNKETGVVTISDNNGDLIEGRDKTFVWQNQGHTITQWLEEQAEEINGDVDLLEEIYLDMPSPWDEPTYSMESYPISQPIAPVKPEEIVQPEKGVRPTIGFFAKWFESKRRQHEQRVSEYEQSYIEAIKRWEQQVQNLELAYLRSYECWEQQSTQWSEAKAAHEEAEKANSENFAQTIRTDVKVMEALLENEFSALDWPRETLVDFQVEDGGRTIWVDVDLPEIEDFPQKVAVLSANGRKLNIKNKAKKQSQLEYAKHIHGVALRLVGYVLSTLPLAEKVVVSGYSQRLNRQTGHIVDDYLYSIKFTRTGVEQFNFADLDKLDPVEAITLFEHRRSMTVTGILRTIEPFELDAIAA